MDANLQKLLRLICGRPLLRVLTAKVEDLSLDLGSSLKCRIPVSGNPPKSHRNKALRHARRT